MNVGGDWGYHKSKLVADNIRASFLSVVGTPEQASFGLTNTDNIILTEPQHVQVGAGAVLQSRSYSQREDRAWTGTSEWYHLFLAGLSELTIKSVNVNLVTGLPIAFYGDKEKMQDRLTGPHQVKRDGRNRQTFTLSRPRIVPQPFGALLSMALDKNGNEANSDLTTGNIGVIDLGGKTCNILSVNALSEISRETASVNVGGWDAVRSVRAYLKQAYPGLDNIRPHDLMNAIVAKEVRYYGEPVNLTEIVNSTLSDIAKQVISETSRLWGSGALVDHVLIAGGGALLLGDAIKAHFPDAHARIVDNPVWANAEGFWRFAKRVEGVS